MDQLQTFRFGLRGENEAEDFLAATSDPRVIQEAYRQMSLPIAKRWHINGPISRVRPGNNLGWSWKHMDSRWAFAQLSMELCDAKPSYIEQHLDDWLKDVGRACPWSSFIKGEEE
jgi:hypothetical protein